MARKILALDADGKAVLRLPSGETQSLPQPERSWVLLVIDCSSSMAGAKLVQARTGAVEFAEDASNRGYSVGLIAFATSATVVCRPEDGFRALARSTERLLADGGTNMTDAIECAARELNTHSGIRVMVIATDGMPDNRASAVTAAASAKQTGIEIITIGTDDADRHFLEMIASRPHLSANVPRGDLKGGIARAVRMLPDHL